MTASFRFLRLVAFILIAPVIAIIMAFMFIMPINVDWWFSRQRRQEAIDVWRRLWSWVQGQADSDA